jgi:LAO/AO transport system kinase
MDLDNLARRLKEGDRRALSRAITLVESSREDHRRHAIALLERITDPEIRATRIGLSGTPGVGKSTFIESFGRMLTDDGLSVAVLAVDPSSARSGGSILGDKTRMGELARDPKAFIRPSPAQCELGGVARRTRESVALCEAAGFDVVIVETVGVGQSETMVARMTDLFVLLLAPGGGDELQGVKRGIMEIADLILINKADGEMRRQAKATRADYAGALRLLRKREGDPEDFPKALAVSAVERAGLERSWEEMQALVRFRKESGHWDRTRRAQNRHWFEEAVRHGIMRHLATDPETRERMAALGEAVAEGRTAPSAAADEMVGRLFPGAGAT